MENISLVNNKIIHNFTYSALNWEIADNSKDEIENIKKYLDVDSNLDPVHFDLRTNHQGIKVREVITFIQEFLSI